MVRADCVHNDAKLYTQKSIIHKKHVSSGIAAAWGSLTKEISQLKQIDSINKKFKAAQATQEVRPYTLVAEGLKH